MTTKAATQASEHAFLMHQEIGDSFSGIYCIESVYIKLTVTSKKYTDMILRDKSGSRNVKCWQELKGIEKGDFVFISAIVEDYQGTPSIISKNVEKEDPPGDLSDYIPVYDDSAQYAERFDELREILQEKSKKVGDETAGLIVSEVYRQTSFFTRFISSPGSESAHYGRQGGLLANTVRVTDAAHKMSAHYHLTEFEEVILLGAGLIHRIGAIDAFEFVECVPTRSKRGNLMSVNSLFMTRMAGVVRRVVTAAKANGIVIDQDVLIRILHAVESQDKVSIKPMTKEALVLSNASQTDLEIVEAMEFIENDLNENEEFTAWDPVLRRRYFKG